VADGITENLSEKTDSRGIWSKGLSRFRKNPLGMSGLWILLVLYTVAILAPVLTPYDPYEPGELPAMRYLPPSLSHPLGTDKFGRDVLTRILFGARISLSISFIAVAISVVIGTVVGAVSGYFGGLVDSIIMRFVDALMSIPRLFLLLTCIALFNSSVALIVILLGATGWMATARLVRGQVLALKEKEFIKASQALGAGSRLIIFKHLIPNTLTVIVVAATLRIGGIILTEAALSFLGIGVPPPIPSWGQMVFEGREVLMSAWWVSAFPGIAIALTVVAYNLLGDALKDAFDPRQFM